MNYNSSSHSTAGQLMDFDTLTKIKGSHTRHIEQLWDEINKANERIRILEKEMKGLKHEVR